MASVYENRRMDERPLDSKPVSELISDALQQFSRLVRSEVALARAEVSDKAKQAARGSAMLGVAAVVALPSLFLLMMALAAFLVEMGLAASLSYLITAVIGFIIAGILAKVGLNRLRADALMPNRTINQLHRDAATMKEHI
ncbi:phage holin family protein [Aestuariivirga sp.]|uniref:phage holin family protein n=1 Tax=Aestuariivirga sp. TaxID=2650926 RepID=UPI00391D6F6A